jgi:predicted DNA-binding helix-hairpin-helix protein
MDAMEQLVMLSCQMDVEPDDGSTSVLPRKDPVKNQISTKKTDPVVISTAIMPGGKRIKLLKTLLSSACEMNCYYCPFRSGRDFRRATFKPDEMAKVFISLYQAGIAEGLFLSSGIIGGSQRTQDQLLDTAELLRRKYGYRGYLHLKLMPGIERAQVFRAMQYASRVSVNLEAPNSKRLVLLAPRKTFIDELLQPLYWLGEIRQNTPSNLGWNGHWPSITTQFVVGAVGESDLELLKTTAMLYKDIKLSRTYFSIFKPVQDTPFENLPAASSRRGNCLYQASFLLRDYGFRLDELPFGTDDHLPTGIDPKTAWAILHLKMSPIEINNASRDELLRIPGIGPIGAQSIIKARRRGHLTCLDDLKRIGVNPASSGPFVLLNGKRPPQQSSFW